jgi:hypothetical protein
MSCFFSYSILERDLWKQKYLIAKKQTTTLEEQTKMTSVQIEINLTLNCISLFLER